jgi:Spy/CpxP family protein refolding chaperone
MPLKQEAQTQLRAYRNPARPSAPSAPSRVRLTSEAEVDRLCSNDEPDRRPLKREAQTRLRTIAENLVDLDTLVSYTFILAILAVHWLILLLFIYFY